MKCDCEEEKKCSIDDDDVMQGSSRSEEKTKKNLFECLSWSVGAIVIHP